MPNRPHTRPAYQTALITGASAGLGAEFARQLAAKGVHLVLSARRVERLEALGEELSERYGVAITVLGCDLAQPDAVDDLVAQLDAQALHIDWLVNNAGYGLTGNFESRSWDEHADFLRVLLEAPLKLTHRLLPAMRERGFGRIVNVSSLAGLVPATAGHTLYGAVKSALVRFSQALGQECAPAGIHVSALCPGFTLTEFHDVNGTRSKVSKMPKFMWMDAPTVVRQGIAAVEHGDLVRTNGLWNAAVHRLTRLLPESWSLKLVAGRAKDFRSSEKL